MSFSERERVKKKKERKRIKKKKRRKDGCVNSAITFDLHKELFSENGSAIRYALWSRYNCVMRMS
jgi:hypothetical protein